MNEQSQRRLQSFASLHWYDETIKFVFNFVTKTSELLLAAGVVISTANFLTDGDVMGHNRALSDAWSWAQALAIDSSLGIVFMNAFQAVREREKIKAAIYFSLTVLLATVAGLITHFDALAHAAGLPVTIVARIVPLWIMTALRAVAVIGFLLASRLKNVSFNDLRRDLAVGPTEESEKRQGPPAEPAVPTINYDALATALVAALRDVRVTGEQIAPAAPEAIDSNQHPGTPLIASPRPAAQKPGEASDNTASPVSDSSAAFREECSQTANNGRKPAIKSRSQKLGSLSAEQEIVSVNAPTAAHKSRHVESADTRLSKAYGEIKAEGGAITGAALSKHAGVRKQTALVWLQQAREPGSEQDGKLVSLSERQGVSQLRA